MRRVGLMLALSGLSVTAGAAEDVQFLHWWTSKSEQQSAQTIHAALKHIDLKVVNVPVEGGGGSPAKSILQARAIAGTPPEMAQLEGPALRSWATLGFLHDVDAIASSQRWDEKLYPFVKEFHTYNGQYVAVPITLHRLNWMWVNNKVLAQHNLSMPTTWDELIATFQTLKNKGISPLAMGNDPWQVVQLFENIAFGLGGPDYYREAFINLSATMLDSPTTLEALATFRTISNIVASDLDDQRWDQATSQLLAGERVFQITGDWAVGELIALSENFGDTIHCVPPPAIQPGFIFNMDSIALFNTPSQSKQQAYDIANQLSSADFLQMFNEQKGSLPPRKDITITGFNACSQQAKVDLIAAQKAGTLIPSLIDSMAVKSVVQKAVVSELYRFFNDPNIQPSEVITHIRNITESGLPL